MFNGVGVVIIGTYAYSVERSAATAVPDVWISSELTAQVSHRLLLTSSTSIMESRPAHRHGTAARFWDNAGLPLFLVSGVEFAGFHAQ